MKLIEKTKAYFGERALNSRQTSGMRHAAICSIRQAKSIGILFNATHQISFEIVKELVKNISSKENTVEVLGFVDSKQLIDHYLYRKGFEFFTRSQLNWYYKPESEGVEKFVNQPFDILMDLSLDEPFPIQYILAFSKAKFKVGKYTEGHKFLDLMIDVEKEKEAMIELQKELEKDRKDHGHENPEVERIVNTKVETEIQLNFLINQLIHYLSLIKN